MTYLRRLLSLLVSPPATAGVWGDAWGHFAWGQRSVELPVGLSLYAPTTAADMRTFSVSMPSEHVTRLEQGRARDDRKRLSAMIESPLIVFGLEP